MSAALPYWSEPGVFNVLDPWYDYPDYGLVGLTPNDNSTATATRNAVVLQQIIYLAQAYADSECPGNPYGAIILFPGHTIVPEPVNNEGGADDVPCVYYFQVPSGQTAAVKIACNWPLKFLGTGNIRLALVLGTDNAGGDIFLVQTGGFGSDKDIGGTTFENLQFTFGANTLSSPPQWAAIHVNNGSDNVRVLRCIFQDCPIGVWFEDVLQCSILQCTFVYESAIGTAVYLGNITSGDFAKEIFISDSIFQADDAPAGSTALFIQSVDQVFVSNCHIDSFAYGIQIVPGPTGSNAIHLHFTSCSMYAGPDAAGNLGHPCLIQPQGSDGEAGNCSVGQVIFTSCFFELGDNAMIPDTGGGPGILIDASYGYIDTVRFVSCYSTRWPGPGLKIMSTSSTTLPNNIEILGGMYAGNNFPHGKEYDALDSYGIWVSAASGVRISGASCVGKYYYMDSAPADDSESPVQDVGIYVDANASDVIIEGCDIRNNNVEGIYINGGASGVLINGCNLTENGSESGYAIVVNAASSAVSNIFIRNCDVTGYSSFSDAISVLTSGESTGLSSIQVTDCAGYNGVATAALSVTAPTSGTPFSNYLYNYYGPVSFYVGPNTGVAGLVTVSINGISTQLHTGPFFLAPGQSGELTITGSPTFTFVVIAQ